ncbi:MULTISPECIES: class I SAM-dependent methyltransferase [Mesorhizobium]|uniref:class I SAM-dependent methyltransferase n=1 Tax=Mesorhizobium TaxID=68287 RepID=UPI0010A9660B|nr:MULTISPECIES: class I SAM-dependent methyltransferase [Mesorhizobium]
MQHSEPFRWPGRMPGMNEKKAFYDEKNSRIVHVGTIADDDYWDSHWAEGIVLRPDRFVVETTKQYLTGPAKVLDAGCGLANTVYGLHQAGFSAHGIDFAQKTVGMVNRAAPHLQVTVGDVRATGFADEFFDGVWSLGVIEHFFDGYDEIVLEMRRIIRSGGIAFVTVPSISPLRRLKARMGLYPRFSGEQAGFYQFVLEPSSIVSRFEQHGFKLLESRPRGGFKGLKDETFFARPMQAWYDSSNGVLRGLRAAADRLLGPFSHHTRLYVFHRV